MEKRVNVKPIGIMMACDKCKDSNLKYYEVTDFNRDDNCFYKHTCVSCGDTKWLFNRYPFVKYEFNY